MPKNNYFFGQMNKEKHTKAGARASTIMMGTKFKNKLMKKAQKEEQKFSKKDKNSKNADLEHVPKNKEVANPAMIGEYKI